MWIFPQVEVLSRVHVLHLMNLHWHLITQPRAYYIWLLSRCCPAHGLGQMCNDTNHHYCIKQSRSSALKVFRAPLATADSYWSSYCLCSFAFSRVSCVASSDCLLSLGNIFKFSFTSSHSLIIPFLYIPSNVPLSGCATAYVATSLGQKAPWLLPSLDSFG